MAERTCSVDGCDRKHYASTYCRLHYRRWYATGEPGPVDRIRETDRDGCGVDGCTQVHKGKGYCRLHYHRWVKTGDPLGLLPPTNPVRWGSSNGNWKGASVAYITAHQRVARSRGKAASHICEHCGKRAFQWAYDYSDPQPLLDERGCPYSVDVDRYMPLCSSCHKRFDLAQREAANGLVPEGNS